MKKLIEKLRLWLIRRLNAVPTGCRYPSCFMRFIMQAQKMPLHMYGDNGLSILNGQ